MKHVFLAQPEGSIIILNIFPPFFSHPKYIPPLYNILHVWLGASHDSAFFQYTITGRMRQEVT